VIPPAAQTQILKALYGRLGLRRVRSILDQGVQKTRGAPYEFGGKLADGHIAFVKQASRHGLSTFFPSPVYVEPWMRAPDVDAYVDWAMAMLKRWRAMGLEPPYYSPLNEPEINEDFPPEWMRAVVLELGSRLRANGFKTKLVVPDDENPRDALARAEAVLADPNARRYVGAIAYHVYRWDKRSLEEVARVKQLAARYRLPVWMTEYSSGEYRDWRSALDWAEKMHVLLTAGGVSAVDYMWGFFGSWARTDTLVAVDFADGAYAGHAPTPLYWLMGHYSRHVRPGYVRVAATTTPGPVTLSAYRGRRDVVVVATNPSSGAARVKVSLRGGTARGPIKAVRSSSSERWRALPTFRATNRAFTITLPPESIVTLTAAR
jgi:O-glycosyl hydrolase